MNVRLLWRWSLLFVVAATMGVSSAFTAEVAAPKIMRVYMGTYTKKTSKGIYVAELDLATGKASAPQLAAEVSNPSFVTIDRHHGTLYAVSEIDKPTGSVTAFRINTKTGLLTVLGDPQSSGGNSPCYVAIDPQARMLLVANYGDGVVESLPIRNDGALGPPASTIKHTGQSVVERRQAGPHAHSINADAAGRFAIAADLGIDKLLLYQLDGTQATLTPHEPAVAVAPGSGPRHFAFHPSGKFAYLINEIANTLVTYAYDAERGELKQLQSLTTLPADFKGTNNTAEVVVHPSGKFVYGSNRGHDSIALFTVDEQTGKLTANGWEPTQGKQPRNFAIDPTGKYLLAANQGSDTIVVFAIDPASGKLKATGQKLALSAPVCVKFMAVEE